MTDEKVGEEQSEEGDKHPETVSWDKYVGTKQSLGNKLDKATEKVTALEEQLKDTISADEHAKVKQELEEANESLKTTKGELETKNNQTMTEKLDALVKKGFDKEKAANLSEKEIDLVSEALDGKPVIPKPDLGGGSGGSDNPTRGREKIQQGFEALHPKG